MQHLLSEFQQRRLDWAFEAKDDFLNQFRIFDAVEKTAENKKIIVSVYGPTQVGKTTLILSLLGVKEQYLENISEFLRGKRLTGESATITVTKYQVSPTEDYIIKLPGEKEKFIQTSEQLEENMVQLRRQVEMGNIQSVEPVVIAIPKSNFEEREIRLELIDLPGIESAETKELKHVERCVKYWIPNSHVCLIVNGAGDLTFLRDIQMPQLNHWYDYPENYFIVLTRAFSPESVQRRIQKHQIKDADEVKDYYRREIQEIIKRSPGTIYPLEIGISLKKLPTAERSMADAIFNQLYEKIQNIDFHTISFNFLTGYYEETLKQGKKTKMELENGIKEREEELIYLQNKLIKISEEKMYNMEIINERWSMAEKNMDAFMELEKEVFSSGVLLDLVVGKYKAAFPDKKASKLNQFASNVISEVQDKLNEALKQMNIHLNEINRSLSLSYGEKLLFKMNSEIAFYNWDHSKINSYLFQKKFNMQKQTMYESLLSSIREVSTEVQKAKEMVVVKWGKIEQTLVDTEIRETSKFSVKEAEQTKLIRLKAEEVEILAEELQRDLQDWAQDSEHARNYRIYFIKHFLARKKLLLKMAIHGSLEEKQLARLYLYTLSSDAAKIIDSLELKNESRTGPASK